MFEALDDGVIVHGEVDEVNVNEANQRLEDIRVFASVECAQSIAMEENWNAKWSRIIKRWSFTVSMAK